MAAVLSAGAGAALSHRSAGQIWRILPAASGAPEVTRPTNARTRRDFRIHRAPLPPDEIVLIRSIPVTTPPRTLLDLADVLSQRQLEKAFNEMEVLQLTDKLSIPDLIGRYPARRATGALRKLLQGEERARGPTRSELEDRFKAVLEKEGLPMPRFNAHVAVAGRFFEVDCLWQEKGLIVELDGRAVHGTRRAFERDRERDRLLIAGGWSVVRVTWCQLQDDASNVLADLRMLLRKGSGPPTL